MTETQVSPWAPTVFRVVCRLGSITPDQADAGDDPDLWTQGGTVVLRPAVTRCRITAGGVTRMVAVRPVTCQIIPATGELMGPTGVVGVSLLDARSGVDPAGWTWHAQVTPAEGEAWQVEIDGSIAVGGVVDLAVAAGVPSSAGEASLTGRVAALEARPAAPVLGVAPPAGADLPVITGVNGNMTPPAAGTEVGVGVLVPTMTVTHVTARINTTSASDLWLLGLRNPATGALLAQVQVAASTGGIVTGVLPAPVTVSGQVIVTWCLRPGGDGLSRLMAGDSKSPAIIPTAYGIPATGHQPITRQYATGVTTALPSTPVYASQTTTQPVPEILLRREL